MAREDGSVLVMTVLALPALLSLLVLVAAGGSLYVSRGALQSAVDMAALAGAQELDWEALGGGTVALVPECAEEQAVLLLWLNLTAVPRADSSRAEITVRVVNATPDEPLPHPGTGRLLRYPTVWVMVRVPVRPAGAGADTEVWLWASADASVEPRR